MKNQNQKIWKMLVVSVFLMLMASMGAGMLYAVAGTGNRKSEGTRGERGDVIYVDAENGDDVTGNGSSDKPYKTIRKGVNESSDGDTILVNPGNYTENVNVNKTLTIKSTSGNPEDTVVSANNTAANVFEISMDWVNISGFKINGATDEAGIYLNEREHCNIYNNSIENNRYGIYFHRSSDNTISDNNLSNNKYGIYFYYSDNNIIIGNEVESNDYNGIYMYYSSDNLIGSNKIENNRWDGIDSFKSNDNMIINNRVMNSGDSGIYLFMSSGNTLSNNIFENNDDRGIKASWSSDNLIYFNTLGHNSLGNVYSRISANTWRTPTEICYIYQSTHKSYMGNYYSDYEGSDEDKDGIGDTPYDLPDDEPDDEYPLMLPFDCYPIQAWWLKSDGTMYKGDTTGPFGNVLIIKGESNTWIADYPAAEDTAFPLNTNWTGYLTFVSAPQDGHNFRVEIGYSDGTDFTPGEPNATLKGDGSKTAFAFETSAAEFTVPKDNYLSLRITSDDSDYEVRTGGGWSYISSPKTDPGYPREGLETNFSAEPIVVATDEDVNFTGETSGGSPPYTCKWYFGDGKSSTEQNPTHKYEEAGLYTVTLCVADSHRNKAIAIKENYIIVMDIDFTADERILEVDETVEFTDKTEGGTPPYSYEWDFNYNGTVDSTLQNPSWNYCEPGTYTASLKVTGSGGKGVTGIKEDFITVFDPELTLNSTGNFGGAACSVAVQGNHAYLGQGSRLIALNISGEEPEKVGSLALPDIASEIFIKDNYAYIANSESGLSIVDISRPANLTIAGSAHIPDGECKGVFVSGNYAYLAAGEKGLQVVNISNPSNPYVDSSLEIGRLRHVFIPGPYYGGGNSPETVVLNEVHPSNETSGEWIEIYNGGSENISLVDWRLMNGTGDLNYTIPETGADWNGTLEPGEYLVVHITKEEDTPGWDIYANLSELLNDTGDSISLFDNESNAVDFMRYGNCTYAPPVGTEWHGDNPEAPTASQSIGRNKNSTDTDDGADWENTGGIDSGFPTPGEQNFNIILYAVGYDPQHWRFSLWTIDITDPSNPTQIGSGDIERDEGLFVLGTYAYIAATFSGGLQILDIENALNPSLVGSFGAWDVAVFDVFVRIGSTYAYLAATNSGLVIVNVTDPENITQVASLDIEGGANSIHVTYPYAYLAGRGDIGFIEVNISDPSDLTVPQKMEEPGSIHGTCISGSYLYLSSNDRLWAYNLSGPDDPTPAASYTNWTNMDCLFAQGNYLYALDGEKMYVIDIFDPYNLSEEGTYEPNGWPIWLHVSGSYAYILTGWPDKLLIIDISIPSSPKKEGELNLSDTGVDVFVENNIAHIVYSKEGLQLIDVSNPEFPAELGFAHIVGEGNCIWAFGNYTFVGSSTEGEWYLEAFNVSDPKNPRRVAVTGGLGDSINIKGENNTLFLAVLGGGFYILEFNLTREVFTFLGKQHSQETGAKGRGASTSGTDEGGTRGGGSMGSYRSVIQIGDWNPETRSGHIYKSEVVRDKPPWYRIKWGVLRLEVKLKKHENEECCLETTVSPSDAADDGCKASPAYTEGKCGSKVNVAATAAEGWIFDKWTGAAGGSIPTTKATMTEKCSVAVAHFVPKCCLETEVSPVEAAIDGCTATPAYTEGKCGDKVDVEAIEVEPWNFVEWTGAASGGSPVTEATMDGHCSIAIAHFIRPSLTLGNGSGPRFICPKAENKNVTIINISLCINPADNWIVRSVTFNAYGSGSEKDDITEARLYLGGADGVLLDTGTYSADNGTITFNVDTVIRVGSCINLVMVYDFVEMNCSSPCKAFNAEINVTGVSALPINYPHFIKRSDPENITGGPVVIGCVWNVDTEECFDTIQEAIDDPDTKNGHTIEVCPGTYTENVNVTKELTIRSIINDPEETIIRAVDEDDDVIRVSSDNVTIKGFTITGSTSKSGIYANGVENLRVENCIFNDNYIGILCENGTTARINWNEIEANSEYGIRNLDLSSEKIDAENNWWGDENGPGGAGPGTGDKVSWNVDFVPWIGGTIPRFKQQQVPAGDEGTIDAKNETDAEIDYETSKPATITVFRYNENPGDDGIPDDLGKYIDVSIDDPSALVEMMIRFYYNETELGDRDETTLRMYWWNGDSWNQCSDTGVNTTDVYGYAGYVWARILGSTDPNLPRLYDPPFGIGGESGGPITRTVEVTIDDIQEKIEPNASITVSGDITITPSGNVQNVGIYLDEVFYENATFTNSNYTCILTLPAELAESAHTIMVKVTLETGETGTENKTIIYEPEPVEHTITITIDEITEKIKPGNEITVSGTITVVPEAEIQIIKILLDGTEAATATLDGSRYSGTLTLPEDLTEGKHTITVNATIITGESDEASTEINYKVSGDGDEGIGAAAIAGVVVVLIVVILIVLIMMGVISLGGKKGKEERMPEYPEEKETETRGKPEEKEQEKAEKPVEEKGERGKTETEKEASQKEEPITEEKERDGEC